MYGLNHIFGYASRMLHIPEPKPRSLATILRLANRTPVRENMVTLDTETTGIAMDDQIISLSITSVATGSILFHSMLKPSCPIHPKALEVHGITADSLKNSPTFADVYPQLKAVLEGKELIIYNAEFDVRMLEHSCIDAQLPRFKLYTQCLMLDYATYFGEYKEDESKLAPTWQRLELAAQQLGVDISDVKAHSSLDDCEITRRVYLALRAKTLSGEIENAPSYWSN